MPLYPITHFKKLYLYTNQNQSTMKSISFSIWLQSNAVDYSHTMNERASELEAHYLIPAMFAIMVITIIAAIMITHQKHRR